jgi:hypothetical protein
MECYERRGKKSLQLAGRALKYIYQPTEKRTARPLPNDPQTAS